MTASAPRILFFCNDYPYFMAHRAHVALRAAAEGYEVHVLVGGDVSGHDPALPFVLHPVVVDRLKFSASADMALVRSLARLGRRLEPQAIQFITMKPIVFGALASMLYRFRMPVMVATFPGLGRLFEGKSHAGRARRMLVTRLLKRFFAMPGRFATFENRADRAFMVDGGVIPEASALVVAGAGIDLSAFSRAHATREAAGSRSFLWASRLIRGKGLSAFVDAARLARSQGSAARFLVAGYPDPGHPDNIPEDELAALWADGAVEFLGHVGDMPELFSRIDVLVLPTSYQEGLPRTLIEAAAAGVPSIVSNIAGCLEVVEHERTGLVLDGTDGAAIWKAVRRMESEPDLLHRTSMAARARIMQGGYDDRSVQDVFLKLFSGNRA